MRRISMIGKSFFTMLIALMFVTGCGEEYIPPPRDNIPDVRDTISENLTNEEQVDDENKINTTESRGSKTEIPEEIQNKMKGISMPEGATVTFDDLSYLTIPYHSFNGEILDGHMVVDEALADEVLDIFEELYLMEFPIERMEIIDEFKTYIDDTFNSLDRASMSRNNTSSFCYRVVAGTERLSYHAYGRAIDINPRTNPYCILSTGYVSPSNAYEYADRTKNFPGMIRHGDEVYEIFTKRGWEWGGDWYDEKDYQHFQKR